MTTETTETTAPSDPAESTEDVPYTYTINEDGSVVITLNGVPVEETTTTGTVVTNGGRLNLRTGAGMSYEIIDQLRCGEEVTVIGTEGDWYEVIVPEKTGFVHSDYLELMEDAKQNSEIDSAWLAMLMQLMEGSSDGDGSFTPSGNMTLIDDFLQIEALATEDSPQRDKQFITLQSKSGNTFYLVIDRSGDSENVYFMNLVDEADLMALIESEEGGASQPVCSCTEKCTVGAVNTNCEICKTNMSYPIYRAERREQFEQLLREDNRNDFYTEFLPANLEAVDQDLRDVLAHGLIGETDKAELSELLQNGKSNREIALWLSRAYPSIVETMELETGDTADYRTTPDGIELEVLDADEKRLAMLSFRWSEVAPLLRGMYARQLDGFGQERPEPSAETPAYHAETVAVYPGDKNHLPYDVVVQTLRTNEPEPPVPAAEPEKTLDEVLDEHPISIQVNGEWQTFCWLRRTAVLRKKRALPSMTTSGKSWLPVGFQESRLFSSTRPTLRPVRRSCSARCAPDRYGYSWVRPSKWEQA